jgi:uncharacterized protein (TIGR03790 family)
MTMLRHIFFLLITTACLRAMAGGDEVIVVYNTKMAGSKMVAEHYAKRRGVPASQVFGFALTTKEDIKRSEYRERLAKPLAKMLEDKKLWHIASTFVEATTNAPRHVAWKVVSSKIRYAALCYGVPLRIEEDPNLREPGSEKVRPEMQRNCAAVDNELACLPMIEENMPLHGPLGNWRFGETNTAFLHPTNGVLLVTRLDGPSAEIANALVDKAMEAETNGLWGRAYFDLRSITDPGFKMGDDWIRGASEVCRRLGFETIVDDKPATFPASFPMSQIGIYMGWYNPDVCGPLAQPEVEFMPGAFAYHLHSYSASSLRVTNRSWVGPLLAKGVTATMGSVAEPYLGGTPDVAVFISRFLQGAFTFGEAAYAGQSVLSWQTTVVGDPLYRPFGKPPDDLHKDLARRKSKLLEWSFLRLVNLHLVAGQSQSEVAKFLEDFALTKESAVLSEKLGDLYAALGKPSSAAHAWAEALKLGPTPQQRVRVTLEMGEKLASLDREHEAYESYQALLKNVPDYPEKLMVLKKLVTLGEKLKRKGDVDVYQAEINKLSPQVRAE